MPSIDSSRSLCVSIHDVAPPTWPQCACLMRAIRAVADIPLTLLVVPAYHHHPVAETAAYDRLLEQRLSLGDELALHGYTHLDEGSPPAGWRDKFTRQIYTQGEGEFAAIDAAQARQRLAWGLEWFERRKWPVQGFVAPAWLLGEGAWQALNGFSFKYTTTLSRFHFLAESQSLYSPSLVYSARSKWGSALSRHGNSAWSAMLRNAPLVRLGLHPNDARYPQTILHFQTLLEKLLVSREALTKASFTQKWNAAQNREDRLQWKSVAPGIAEKISLE